MKLLQRLRNDDTGVSPVIGVILMVAITVILAAVIATFVLGLGDQVSDTAPSASFSGDWEENEENGNYNLTIRHTGGADIPYSSLSISGDGGDNLTDEGDFTAGETIEVTEVGPGDRIDLIWSSNGQSSTLRSFQAPSGD